MVDFTASLIGSLLTSVPPIVYSILIETRFVDKRALIIGGIVSWGFGFSYYSDANLSNGLQVLKLWALAAFLIFGFLSIIVGIKVEDNDEGPLTLLFAQRQYGAIALAFMYPVFLGALPPELIASSVPGLAQLAIVFLFAVNALTGVAYLLKNRDG